MSNTPLDFADADALTQWLCEMAKRHDLNYLLAHADDGVIWGKFVGEAKTISISHDAFPKISPPLSRVTLQQARIFGENGEVLLVRSGKVWQAFETTTAQEKIIETFDEQHLLWGDEVREVKDGFALLGEGAQGMLHAPPVDLVIGELKKRLHLTVRHWIQYDDQAQARVTKSRLVTLEESNKS